MASNGRRRFACGLVCLFSSERGDTALTEHLARDANSGQFGFALVYFSKAVFSPGEIVSMMQETCDGLPYAACSTAGEITPMGLGEGGLVVILFPHRAFRIAAHCISDLKGAGIEKISDDVASQKAAFLFGDADPAAKTKRNGGSPNKNVFAMCLNDGMSYSEEAVTAAIHWGLDETPLIGGSAGDDLNFTETSLILNGEILHQSAIFMLVESALPFQIFKTENFVPTANKLVVTQSDPDRRIVHELNAAPAAIEYASVIGKDPGTLTPQSFASHPLVVRVGGEYFCRSIQKVNDDNSLSFFCAIDDGIVLTFAEPTGMARSTSEVLDNVRNTLGDIDFVLGFDCVLRQVDARNRQVTQRISEIYKANSVIGFHTYGEQYGSMHLNQTFTGIAFGTAH